MRSLGSHRVAVNMNSNFNLCHSPSSSGECKDEKVVDDSVVDETIRNVDLFETQVVDYGDDDDDTQLADFDEETQMDLAGETQIMDDYDDFAGETQLLIVSDNDTECDSDGEGAGGTQVLDDTVHLNDIQVPDTIDMQTNGGENINSECCQDDGGATAESLPSVDVIQHSDSLCKGFTSVHNASLRAADLSARMMASGNTAKGSCLTKFNNRSSKCRSVSNDGIHTGGRVNTKNDLAELDEIMLGNSNKSNVRCLARKLFMEEDFSEASNNEPDLKIDEISQLPGCDNDLAGLSYVDSQEPGELSQANALKFVDRFLKVTLLEPDEDAMHTSAVCKTVTPGSFKKGANSIARDANRRSSVASASIFEWDDKAEDEGGGEFFIKKRELLLGNCQVSQKSCNKTMISRKIEAKASKYPGRIVNEEQRNMHDTTAGFPQSDSKLARGRKAGKFDKVDMEKKDEHFTDQKSCLDPSDRLASDALPNAESPEFLNVGIDTQMAAEAIEELSNITALVGNSSSMAEGPNNVVDRIERRETKNVPKRQNSAPKRAYASNSGIVTRSQRKSGVKLQHSLASKPHSQHLAKELLVDSVKSSVFLSRPNAKNISGDRRKESSDRELPKIDGTGAENHDGGDLHVNQSVEVKRQGLKKKESPLMFAQKNTQPVALNHLSCANCYRERRHSVDGVRTRKRKTRSDTASVNPCAEVDTVNPVITGNSSMLDGSNDKGKDLHQTCEPERVSAKKRHTLTVYRECEAVFGSVARRTRSKRIAQSEKVLKLSLEKQAACSPPAKGTLTEESLGGSCLKMQESSYPAYSTPNNLKTPGNVVSPICTGDEYHTPSRKKSLFLKKECYKLTDSEGCSSPFRVLRQRRDINNVRVLFSQHLDGDIVKQQKKILFRLGFFEASTILEATHFVADSFTRTRNMLEAIANAKLVVTHMWLESCGQANCFIDEKSYVLRDTKKEKELGFNMTVSLARASRHPILEGRRVLLTPNIKPSKDVISSLVKAVHGQAIFRLCRSTSNNEKLLEDLLILSCEEDYEVCSPLLEKGIAVYSSELLLNGIVTQRLEYERHRLFVSHVKKTRSTLWLKKKGDELLRVPKSK